MIAPQIPFIEDSPVDRAASDFTIISEYVRPLHVGFLLPVAKADNKDHWALLFFIPDGMCRLVILAK